ncbi:hypothetical protein KC887_08775 [Candidatus Kaiserbacteria bacterium]|nr:hypothetical protein [Candidatus Kaiserbacteria bacterium]
MAASDFVTEGQLDALVTQLAARANTNVVAIDIGSTASTARTAGSGVQYWICDNGITPANAIEGDLIYNRAA